MIKINKVKLYKKLLITSGLIHLGTILNILAIKANNVWMPVNYSRVEVKMWILTDIFKIPFSNKFFSLGDFVLFLAIVYLVHSFITIKQR